LTKPKRLPKGNALAYLSDALAMKKEKKFYNKQTKGMAKPLKKEDKMKY